MRLELRNNARRLGTVAPFLIVVLIWELVARSGVYNARLFPAPTTILRAFREMIQDGEFARDLLLSVERALVGFGAGSLLGATVGVLTGRSRLFGFLLYPIL